MPHYSLINIINEDLIIKFYQQQRFPCLSLDIYSCQPLYLVIPLDGNQCLHKADKFLLVSQH